MRTTTQIGNQPLIGIVRRQAEASGVDVLAAVSHGLDFAPRPRRKR